MVAFVAIFAFLVIVGTTWWFGLWNNVLNLINFFIAAMVASAYYENVAAALYSSMPTYDYILDFVSLWVTFFLTFGVLRLLTELLSPVRLKFHPAMDMTARSLVCIWLGIAFVFFTVFSMHLAPLVPTTNEQASYDAGQSLARYLSEPESKGTKFFGFGPGRMWMAFIQSRSRGALSASKTEIGLPEYNLQSHPDDADLDARVFDPYSRLPATRKRARVMLSTKYGLRVE